MKTQQISRNEFIRKFNELDVTAKTVILLKAGVTIEESKQIDTDTSAAEIVENFTDGTSLIHDIWSIMEESQLIENNKKERSEAYQDYKNGKIDLIAYAHIVNNITYSEEAQGIEY